ncbi:hypothetical protein CNEO4_1310034 [Clostridium neonatale]|nr:hypothetical protein CNEO2_140062 [Clostridium neonatale]CAI3200725.1 hypothetical protein CNEO2_20169 [Clostridium neonatale]CAI3201166.1 hypothetical protein CNEO2_280062 [Clostridium neonatale]CAI3232819.1 hypothetical protein CNEO2_200036 [Clostridium neonatale]CAI3548286.1 hypothetical protein CNEO3_10152 [Clostridium neonatale]
MIIRRCNSKIGYNMFFKSLFGMVVKYYIEILFYISIVGGNFCERK